MKIGIFGGTFDPPHIGHLILAQEALDQLELDAVLWVLTPFPPHKSGQKISLLEDRISMVSLAIEGNQNFKLSRVDIDRQPPHYATETVSILRKDWPKDELIYLMGADSLNDLPSWHEPAQFVSECDAIGVMVRYREPIDTSDISRIIPGLVGKLRVLETPYIEISGNEIRKRVAAGRSFRYFLPDRISQYVLDHGMYHL